MSRTRHVPHPQPAETVPFESAEEAWFWFMHCWMAREDGARYVAGSGEAPRPCEPVDIRRTLERLLRRRLLGEAELRVMADFGRRALPPDPNAASEAAAERLWRAGIAALERELTRMGVVRLPCAA